MVPERHLGTGSERRQPMPSDEVRWLTYRDMVEALRLPSEKAAMSRSRREKWPRRLNNERGLALVGVPLSAIEAAVHRAPSERPSDRPIETPLANGREALARPL